jgi:predicted house-cleaning noncanonical NTP pyrophosphatase (MazG superfamily)
MVKLVRDKIPELFNLKNIHIADENEYNRELINKLQEEVDEFKQSGEIEELADIMEVIHAIFESKKTPINKLEDIRKEKAEKRGKFEKKIIYEEG